MAKDYDIQSAAFVAGSEGVYSVEQANRAGDATNAPAHDTEEVTSMPDKRTQQHRTTVEIAPERNGVPYENGKRLTDTYQYHGRCMCGWVGPTMPTAGEARGTAREHRHEHRRRSDG